MELDFFFFIGSTYTYLSVGRIGKLIEGTSIRLNWRPFDVRSIMQEQNNLPFRDKPVKTAYMWRDVERRARRHGLGWAGVPSYPVDPDLLANRIATLAAQEGWCAEFTQAVYGHWFLHGAQKSWDDIVRETLLSLHKPPAEIVARANGRDVRQALQIQTEIARAAGVFGSPSFVAAGELFWGDDRLEEAIDWISTR